jgi:hypothetical protein
MEGVSPDDLHPNYGLRKAADLFIKSVMEKMDEIQQEQVDDELDDEIEESATGATLEGESGDKGVIVSRKTMKDHRRKRDDDLFAGGDDDFGGDVFDVAPDEASEDNADLAEDTDDKPEEEPVEDAGAGSANTVGSKEKDVTETEETNGANKPSVVTDDKMNKSKNSDKSMGDSPSIPSKPSGTTPPADISDKKDARRRGPPVGYVMGPAGGARGDRISPNGEYARAGSPFAGRGRGDDRASYRGRGRGRFFDGDYAGRTGRGYQQPRHDGRQEEVSLCVVFCLCMRRARAWNMFCRWCLKQRVRHVKKKTFRHNSSLYRIPSRLCTDL